MSEIIIYDVVSNHLPQDYIGTPPVSIQKTFECLLNWMKNNETENLKLLSPKGCKYIITVTPIDKYQLDSSLFTQTGNDLMLKCYDRWISTLDLDHVVQGNDVPLDFNQISFSPFIQMLKRLEGDPCYVNAEPNVEDAYADIKRIPTIEIKNIASENFSFLNILDADITMANRKSLNEAANLDELFKML